MQKHSVRSDSNILAIPVSESRLSAESTQNLRIQGSFIVIATTCTRHGGKQNSVDTV